MKKRTVCERVAEEQLRGGSSVVVDRTNMSSAQRENFLSE
jgi:predicted kinase